MNKLLKALATMAGMTIGAGSVHDGWYWFDSEDDARVFFNLPKVVE